MSPPSTDAPHLVTSTSSSAAAAAAGASFTPTNATSYLSPSATADVASPASVRSPISFYSHQQQQQQQKHQRATSIGRDATATPTATARWDRNMSSSYTPSESRADGGGGADHNGGGVQQAPSDDGSSNPLKRRNTEAIDYPRRRATIACEVCRSRKSRCDGTKPKCKLCTELGADCVYREPGVKLDAGDKLILDRLDRLEGLVQMVVSNQACASSSAPASTTKPTAAAAAAAAAAASTLASLAPNSGSPTTSNGTVAGDATTAAHAQAHGPDHNQGHYLGRDRGEDHGGPAPVVIPNSGLGTWASRPPATNISTMPKAHTSSAMYLLHWPRICHLVQRRYDPQILLQLEMEREPLHTLTKTPCVDLSNTATYITAYFDQVNVWYACVNPYTWRSHYRTALTNGFREGPESCIVLLVLALGQASIRGSISRIANQHDPPGLQYFTAAWSLLPGMMTSHGVLAAQCHLLAAAYLFYLVRPLEAWGLLSTTSTKLQLLLMSPSRIPPEQRELTERIYWNVLLFESDLLAELDLPHSGVVQFEDSIGLPGGFEGDGRETPVGPDNLWYFLAEIALRRLLNRVIQLIYSTDSTVTTGNLEPVVAELDFQLNQWYENLPLPLQFPFSRTPIPDPVQTVLRLRFYACHTIIYRPYILAVLDDEPAALQPVVRSGCHKCLEASVRQLEHITSHHCGHMPYLWQGALSIVSQTLLLMGATMSPSLSAILLTIVPNRADIDLIIENVVAEVERYAELSPSLGLSAEIIREAEVRRREFLGG